MFFQERKSVKWEDVWGTAALAWLYPLFAFVWFGAVMNKMYESRVLLLEELEAREKQIQQDHAEIVALRHANEELVKALTRLRDCDWVISLPDRMDAVREIAREALSIYSKFMRCPTP